MATKWKIVRRFKPLDKVQTTIEVYGDDMTQDFLEVVHATDERWELLQIAEMRGDW